MHKFSQNQILSRAVVILSGLPHNHSQESFEILCLCPGPQDNHIWIFDLGIQVVFVELHKSILQSDLANIRIQFQKGRNAVHQFCILVTKKTPSAKGFLDFVLFCWIFLCWLLAYPTLFQLLCELCLGYFAPRFVLLFYFK